MIGSTPKLLQWLNNAPPFGGAWLDTLIIRHASWAAPFYLVAAPSALTMRLEDNEAHIFVPYSFRIQLPGSGVNGKQELQIQIDNTGGDVWEALEVAQQMPAMPITVEWRVFLSDDLTKPQAPPYILTASRVSATTQAVQITAARADLINRRWPNVVYRPDRWPGLVR